MRISIMGQAAFGEAILARLQQDGHDIAGVSAPQPQAGGKADALWAAAEQAGLPAIPTPELKTPGGLERWRALDADLGVMAFVTEIISLDVLAAPKQGTIQYHPSLLPRHRGSSAINWAIINGDAETGLSIFWPDKGIDTGQVLLQKSTPIGPEDTVGSIYFERLFPMGVEAMAESVRLIAAGKAPRLEQDHSKATYEPACGDEQSEIRWYEPARRIHALIRGCNPQPGAWTAHDGGKLRFFDCQFMATEEAGMPGRVLRIEENSIDIRLNGGVLRVIRVQPPGGKKMPAAEWARAAGIEEGFRFR